MKFFAENEVRVLLGRESGTTITFLGDILPVSFMELYLGFGCLADQLLDVVGPEGGIATKQNIRDNAVQSHINTPARYRAAPCHSPG